MEKKKKIPGMVTAVLCVGILLGMLLVQPVAASGYTPVKTELPVSISNAELTEKFTLELREEAQTGPVPAKELTLAAGEKGTFSLLFEKPGIYRYTIRQKTGSNKQVNYDTSEYQAEIYITEDTSGTLQSATVVYQKGEQDKKSQIVFTNSQKEISSPEEPDRPNPDKPQPDPDTPKQDPDKPDSDVGKDDTGKNETSDTEITTPATKNGSADTTSGSAKNAVGGVRTGDGQGTGIWIVLATGAAGVMVISQWIGKGQRGRKDEE